MGESKYTKPPKKEQGHEQRTQPSDRGHVKKGSHHIRETAFNAKTDHHRDPYGPAYGTNKNPLATFHRSHKLLPNERREMGETTPRQHGDPFYVGRGRRGFGLPGKGNGKTPNGFGTIPVAPAGPVTAPVSYPGTTPLPNDYNNRPLIDRENDNNKPKWRVRLPWLIPIVAGLAIPVLSLRNCGKDATPPLPTGANAAVPTCGTLTAEDLQHMSRKEADLRRNLLAAVERDIGKTETYGDNQGAFVKEVMNGEEGKAWCTGWLTKRLKEVAPGLVPHTWSTHNLVEFAETKGAVKNFGEYTPHVGDIFFVLDGSDPKKPSHSAVVTCVLPGGVINIVSGNKSDDLGLRRDGVFTSTLTPGALKDIAAKSEQAGFISIGSLLRDRNILVSSAATHIER